MTRLKKAVPEVDGWKDGLGEIVNEGCEEGYCE